MKNKEAIKWIEGLIKTMQEETRGNFPDPEYKDEVYEALKMGVKALNAVILSEYCPYCGERL